MPELKVYRSYKLQPHISIFISELIAILLALDFVQDFMSQKTVIFVDSLSALQALQSPIYKPCNQVVLEIYHKVTALTKIGLTVVFEWIPREAL